MAPTHPFATLGARWRSLFVSAQSGTVSLQPPSRLCRSKRRSVFLSSLRSLRKTGAPERIRTSDPQIRSLVLYPAELRALLEARSYIGEPSQRQGLPSGRCGTDATPPRHSRQVPVETQRFPSQAALC